MAPPYDVIPDPLKEQLYSKNPYNIIRLILGKSEPGDNENSNWYTRAAGFLEAWQKEGALVRDGVESFYVYLQEYPYRGKVRRRLGFIGLMKIEEGGKDRVLPHENTLAKPKEDRMNLIKRVASNLSPIFALYNGTSGSGASIKKILEDCTASQAPVIDVKAADERERVWRLSDKAAVEKIVSLMGDKKIFIADGHHRYEVAKSYRDARRQEKGYDGSADHVMMYFTDMADTENLTVMATHRVVKEMPFRGDDEVRERLAEYFDAREYSGIEELVDVLEGSMDERYSFGYYGGGEHILFTARDMDKVFGLMKDDKTREWKLLDVSILHSAVLNALLGASDREGNITYVRDADKGRDLVKDGSHMAAFFLRPTRVDQVRAVAEVGDKMPQKSTYFYPKLLSGLVINRLR